MSGNPLNKNLVPQTDKMYDGDTLSTIDMVVNDYVTTPMTVSATNTTGTLTQAGIANKSWYVTYLTWRISGGNVGTNDVIVSVLDGATIIYSSVISKQQSAGTFSSIEFTKPIKITAGNAITYTASASGTAGTIITLNMGLFNK